MKEPALLEVQDGLAQIQAAIGTQTLLLGRMLLMQMEI
jgi:hypothetical protein